MPTTDTQAATTGSAERWGPLWGTRPADWALSEEQQTPTYEATLERVDLKAGQAVLEIGCGAGSFLRLVTERGARAFGLDASEALIEFAQARLPEADLRVGEMEALPYEDDSFDLVCGFNPFFFANDIIAAIREAGRIAMPGAAVVIQVWGPHERNDMEAVKEMLRPYMPPRPVDAAAEPDYSQPCDVTWSYDYPDEQTVRRALVAPMGIALLLGPDNEEQFTDALIDRLAAHRGADGHYRLQNEFHTLIARA